MTTLRDRKAQLDARLAILEARLGRIDAELESHQSKDWDDLATEREADEVLEGLGLSGQQEIRMIKAALARIEDESFGTCTICGEPIGQERLDAVPFTPFCRACAAKAQ